MNFFVFIIFFFSPYTVSSGAGTAGERTAWSSRVSLGSRITHTGHAVAWMLMARSCVYGCRWMLVKSRYRRNCTSDWGSQRCPFYSHTQTKAPPSAGGFPSLQHLSVQSFPSVQCYGTGAELHVTQPTKRAGGLLHHQNWTKSFVTSEQDLKWWCCLYSSLCC